MRFVESAELRIVDNSTKQLNQIDRKLRALGVTARALKGTLAGLTMPTVPTKGVAAVTAALTAQSRAAAAAARSMERLGASYAGAGRGADRFAAAASHADAEARRLGISRVGVTVSTAQGVAELRKLGAAAQALKRDLSSLALPQLRMAGADGLRKFHSDVRTLKSDLASLAVPQLRAPALAGMATLRAELRAAKAELASLELPQLRAPALDGFKTFRAEIRAAKADIAGLVLPQLRAPNLSPLRQLETEARKAKSALDALMFPPLHVPSPGGIKKLGVEARALKATLDAIAFPALHVPGTADLRKFRAEALVLQRELAGLFIPQLRTPSTAGLKKIATAARNASAELSWLVIPKLHAPSLAPLKKIRDEARKARGELDGLAIPPLRAPSLAGLKKVGAEARKVSAELAGIHIPALHVPSAAGLKSLGAAARTLKAELGSLTMPALHAPSVAPISSVTRAMREQRDAARAAADAVHRLSDAYSVLSRSAPRLGGVVRHTTTNMAGLTAAATGGDWLLEQGRAARAAARGLDRLGTAYASAATKAQRFGSSAASVTQQLHALIGAVGQAKALGKISLGNNLLPGQGGGRRGQGKEKTYSAHLYANPAHSIGNAALSGAFGHDLSLAQALTISAMGSVVVKASHVALEGAKEMSTAHERLFQKGATPEYQDWADREAHRVAAKYKDTSVQDNLETLNDIGAAVHDRGGQAQLMELLAKRQQLMVGQGQDSKEVRDSNVRLIKTLEMSGSLVDQNGHFNAARTEAMLQMIQGVEAVEGRNIDARQVQMAFKYLRENALSQTMGNLRNSLFMAAEVGGSSAGTNIGQAINNLSGHATKEVLANAAQLGLGTAKWETSRSGKRKLVDYQVNDEELLRSDFGGWIEKQLMPKIHDAGIDPKTDVAELSKFLSKIVSRQTSKDALMKWITQHQESANKAEAAGKVKTDEETAERVPERDYTAAFVALEKQMSSAAGDVGKKLNGLILPSVNGAATLFSDLARVVSGTATEAEKSSLVTGGIKATGAGGLALFLGSKLLPMLNPLNGSAVALTGSATALGGSAAALTGAAATLGGAGALGGAGGLAGAAGAAGG
ncbi:hypothetical protein, partial [Methylosinus sp. 3S-1]|uniref:hypothetical protein n=1 Tax=Methylosinus sp. 3S-1 TaxID=1849840 RepID=UPI000ABE31D1